MVIVSAAIVSVAYYYIAFLYKPHLTAIYPAQYFQDRDGSETTSLGAAASLTKELTVSPHTTKYLRWLFIVLTLGGILFLLSYSIRFFIISKRRLRLSQRLLVIPICFGTLIAYIWVLVFFPKYALTPVLVHATELLRTQLEKPNENYAINDAQEILVLLRKNDKPVQIISGYGQYNIPLKELTENPYDHSLSYYKLLFFPTAARTLALAENTATSTVPGHSLNYYPETHQLVINDISAHRDFLRSVSIDLISKLNYPALDALMKNRGVPTEFRILADSEYSKFYVQKLLDIYQNEIKTDQVTYTHNIKVIEDCQKTKKDNDEILAVQTAEYQRNCVANIYYSDCALINDKIEDNKRVAQEATRSCQIDIQQATRYNAEIIQDIEITKEKIREVNTTGTLERNKAELGTGVFISPSTVYLKQDNLVAPVITTSVHEFLHYAVHNKNRDLPEFINEGMTDYLSWKTFGYDTYFSVAISGYYAEMQVLYSLLERIPFTEMLNIYISGSSRDFRKAFETYFPGISYDEFIKKGTDTFNTTYATDSKGRTFTLNVAGRDYIWLVDVEEIRVFLGLASSLVYSDIRGGF